MYTLPNLFRPYIEGREAAIKENWQDLSNFNSTLKGQMENALYGETMGDAADISHDRAAREHINTVLSAANFPVGLQAAALGQYGQSTYGKGLVDAKLTNQLTGQQWSTQKNMQGMEKDNAQQQIDMTMLNNMMAVWNNILTPEQKEQLGKQGWGFPQTAQTAAQNGVAVAATDQNQNQNPAQTTNPDIASYNANQEELKKKQEQTKVQ